MKRLHRKLNGALVDEMRRSRQAALVQSLRPLQAREESQRVTASQAEQSPERSIESATHAFAVRKRPGWMGSAVWQSSCTLKIAGCGGRQMTTPRSPRTSLQRAACRFRGPRPGGGDGPTSLLVCLDPVHGFQMKRHLASSLRVVDCPLEALRCMEQRSGQQVIFDRCPPRFHCCREPAIQLLARIRLAAHRDGIPFASFSGPNHTIDNRIQCLANGGIPAMVDDPSADRDRVLTLNELARSFGASSRQLYRLFRRAGYGPPMREIRRWHLMSAYNELSNSAESLEKIAARLGFHDGATFSRSFKRAFGCYPGTLRRSGPAKAP